MKIGLVLYVINNAYHEPKMLTNRKEMNKLFDIFRYDTFHFFIFCF